MACFRLVLHCVLLFSLACAPAGGASCDLLIISESGARASLRVEVADTAALRERGLMFRKTLGDDRGMLFVFPHERILNFWMKNTPIPLSIAYISSGGVINEILDMDPLDTSVTYPSSRPARYALEVNRGWFGHKGITPGSRVILDGCLGK